MAKTLTDSRWPGGKVDVTVELGMPSPGSGVYLWDGTTSTFGTATWGPDAVWTDVSDNLRSIPKVTRICDRESGHYNAGSIEVLLDNSTYAYSEENTAGPYYGQLRSGIPLRARAVVTFPDGSTANLWIFTGTVDAIDDTYPVSSKGSVAKITGFDCFEDLAAFDGFEQTPRGANELSGSRLQRLLNNAGYTGARNIARGTVQLQATTMAGNCLGEMKLVADSEGGKLWVEADGAVTFGSRYFLLEDPKSNTPQVTFDDSGTSGLIYSAPSIRSSKDLQRFMATYARANGTAQQTYDPVARALANADRMLTRTDLLNVDDPSVLALAQRDVALRKDAERRVDGLTLEPFAQLDAARITQAWRWLCDVRFWHQARVIRRPYGAPFTIDRYVFVSGLSHTISPPSLWSVNVTFQSATVWRGLTGSLFDSAVFDSASFVW